MKNYWRTRNQQMYNNLVHELNQERQKESVRKFRNYMSDLSRKSNL